MPSFCSICNKTYSASISAHNADYHDDIALINILGEEYTVRRQYDRLQCPAPGCTEMQRLRKSLMRHVRMVHEQSPDAAFQTRKRMSPTEKVSPAKRLRTSLSPKAKHPHDCIGLWKFVCCVIWLISVNRRRFGRYKQSE